MVHLHGFKEIGGCLASRLLLVDKYWLVKKLTMCLVSFFVTSAFHNCEITRPSSCHFEMLFSCWESIRLPLL